MLTGFICPVIEVGVWDGSYGKFKGPVERLDLHDLPLVGIVVILLGVMHFLSSPGPV